jgi:hypothetical protein
MSARMGRLEPRCLDASKASIVYEHSSHPGHMTPPLAALRLAGLMLLAIAALPSRGYAQSGCVRDAELALLGIRAGDSRTVVRKRIGRPVTVSKDTVAGADFVFDVTRYRAPRLEVVVSDVTGRVAALIPLDTSLVLPRGIRLGMPLAEVKRRFAPAELDGRSKGMLNVMGCGPKGSGMELRFDEASRLTWVSLNGFYPAVD